MTESIWKNVKKWTDLSVYHFEEEDNGQQKISMFRKKRKEKYHFILNEVKIFVWYTFDPFGLYNHIYTFSHIIV